MGTCQNLADSLKKYNVSVTALQEIRWTGTGQIKVDNYVIYCNGLDDSYQFGTGFAVHKEFSS